MCGSLDSLINSVNLTWTVYEDSTLSKIDSVATYYTTGEVSSVQVIGGSDGWLFYRATKYGTDSIGDYEGTNLYTLQELDAISKSVLKAQNELEKKGIKVVFFIPPNKENVYSEFMPDTYSHADVSRSDLLIECLKEKGIDVQKEFISPSGDNTFYKRSGTDNGIL